MSNLRKIRKARKMTMKQLGERTGVTESAIGQYETGKRQPSYEMLLKLSEELGCTVDDIMRDKENEPAENDEFAEELQIMRDSYRARSLLKGSKGMTDEQYDLIEAMMSEFRRINEHS